MVQHNCFSSEGQSGSGMWTQSDQAIHAILTGHAIINDTKVNLGLQINDFVYSTVARWYNEDVADILPKASANTGGACSLADILASGSTACNLLFATSDRHAVWPYRH